ncbi:hypothetical protein ACFU98_28930 [Streptomyces sp. NPDC057575]|uniref:hypothetical protein n=1 Tax=unclassified Streptomyces TaxID=2593676 RepID=UPI0036B217E5
MQQRPGHSPVPGRCDVVRNGACSGPAASGPPGFREDGEHIVFRGRLSPTGDGTAMLDVSGALLLSELAVPPPPDGVDAAWAEVRVGKENVGLWPYRL